MLQNFVKNKESMKYLKIYEGLLKKTDDRVVNHPLKELINKFVELLTNLAECDDFGKFRIVKYYTEDSVKISYKEIEYEYGSKIEYELFLIQIYKYHDGSYSITQNVKSFRRYKETENREFVNKSLNKILKKYISKENYLYSGGRNEINLDDIDDIMNDIDKIIKDLEVIKKSNKYNL